MTIYEIPEISDGVFLVGVKDWDRRMFDALIPLPHGTSYNSYLVKGKDGVALVDTVNPGFEDELVARINQVGELEEIEYIVMNHAEPDHAGAIPRLMELNDDAILVCTEKGGEFAERYYGIPDERLKIVGDGEEMALGGKTLRFIEAPWLHWPETMFTYLVEDRILFTCDFFGFHTAFGLYSDESESLIPESKKYFGEIMMPYRSMGKKAVDKISGLEIDVIAPSHGPIHRKPQTIVEAYRSWTAGETRKKALVAYTSMWGSTGSMIETMVETLKADGIEVVLYNLENSDVGDIAKDLVDSRAIVLGAPTVLGLMHPLGIYASYLVRMLRPPLKYGVLLSSYGWGAGAGRVAQEILGKTGIELVGALEINWRPDPEELHKVVELGRQLAKKIVS